MVNLKSVSTAEEISSREDLSDKNEMVNLNARSSRKAEFAEKPHETENLSKDKLVAGACNTLVLSKQDKMVAGGRNPFVLLFSAIGLTEQKLAT